jgi:hypothetical protein
VDVVVEAISMGDEVGGASRLDRTRRRSRPTNRLPSSDRTPGGLIDKRRHRPAPAAFWGLPAIHTTWASTCGCMSDFSLPCVMLHSARSPISYVLRVRRSKIGCPLASVI